MVASIHWQPLAKEPVPRLDTDMPSRFITAMERVFGWPCELTQAHIMQLQAMEAAAGNEAAYRELIDLIQTHGAVRLWSVS